MITPPTRIPAQPSTSSRRCHESTFSFRLSPFFSRKKPAPLIMMPITAMPTIPVAFTVSGFRSLGIAWKMITIEPPIRIEAEKSAENRESFGTRMFGWCQVICVLLVRRAMRRVMRCCRRSHVMRRRVLLGCWSISRQQSLRW